MPSVPRPSSISVSLDTLSPHVISNPSIYFAPPIILKNSPKDALQRPNSFYLHRWSSARRGKLPPFSKSFQPASADPPAYSSKMSLQVLFQTLLRSRSSAKAKHTDIKALTSSEPNILSSLAPAFEKYNEEQFATVKLPGGSQEVSPARPPPPAACP
jgi:hypothetical protein